MPSKTKTTKPFNPEVAAANKLAAQFCEQNDLPLLSAEELDNYSSVQGFEESLDWLRFQYAVTFRWPDFRANTAKG